MLDLLRLLPATTGLFLRLQGDRPVRREIDGHSVLVHRFGPEEGEPWLLLHGLGAMAAAFRPLLSGLSRECRLIVPEMSAMGGTVLVGEHDGLAVGPGARVAAALVERELGGRAATVVGMSLGGWTAVRLALDRPELVARLVLVDAAGYREQDWERIERLVRPEDVGGIATMHEAFFSTVPLSVRLTRRLFLRAYTSRSVTSVLETLTVDDTFSDEELASIEVPTALVWGEDDGLFDPEVGRAMAAAMPRGRFYSIAECGHIPHWEKPAELLETVRDFRRRFPVPSSERDPETGGAHPR